MAGAQPFGFRFNIGIQSRRVAGDAFEGRIAEDWAVTGWPDVPMIDTGIVEVPNPYHPYGVRGVGETPIVAPLGGVDAVRDQLGFRSPDLPLPLPKVLAVIDEQGA